MSNTTTSSSIGGSSSSSSSNNTRPQSNTNTTTSAAAVAGEYVFQVYPHDVLFGRGSGPNDHEGNIRFRELVAQRKGEYMATNHRQTKAKIAKDIVDQVLGVGGRFLKKLEPEEASSKGLIPNTSTSNNEVEVYQVVGDDTIMEKAKQALRQNRNNHREESTTGKGTSHSPKPSPKKLMTPPIMADNIGGSEHTMMSSSSMRPVFQPPLTQTTQEDHFQRFAYQQQQPQQQPLKIVPEITSHHQPSVVNYGISDRTAFVPPQPQQQPQQRNNTTDTALYSLDHDGYATYTTILDDPEDERYFPTSSHTPPPQQQQQQQQHSSFLNNPPRRLGGRKSDPFVTGMMVDGHLTGQQQHNVNNNINHHPIMGKRDSLQFHEIWRRQSIGNNNHLSSSVTKDFGPVATAAGQSMQMSDLMESFKGMSTTGELNSSDDTIGTIDGLPAGMMSVAYMSGISQMSIMNMSTDSMFKNSHSLSGHEEGPSPSERQSDHPKGSWDTPLDNVEEVVRTTTTTTTGTNNVNNLNVKATTTPIIPTNTNNNSNNNNNNRTYDSVAESMGSSVDFWNSRQLQGLMQAPMESSSTNFDISHNNLSSSNTFLRGDTNNNNNSKASSMGTPRLSITSETMVVNDSSIPQHLFDDIIHHGS